ncbi:MAG: hypothetical protein JW861_03070 [Bacteroidales bacterium]|nr:hypothetical protein [Bacteroidales bacterium]
MNHSDQFVKLGSKRFEVTFPVAMIIVMLFSLNSKGQDGGLFFFNTASASANRTLVGDDNSAGRWGYGLGLYRLFSDSALIRPCLGVEYNHSSQFKNYVDLGLLLKMHDATFTLHSISFPAGVRAFIGRRINFFFTLGVFLDLQISSRYRGTVYQYDPISPGVYTTSSAKVDADAFLARINAGPMADIGIRFPMNHHHLLIGSGIRYGIPDIGKNTVEYFNRLGVLFIAFSF